MNMLVTGGAGFIGTNFVRLVMKDSSSPDRIVNLDALTYAGRAENLSEFEGSGRYQFVRGDIADQELVANLLRTHQVEAVIHFAAESHVDRSIKGPSAFVQTNVVGTCNLLEAVRGYWQELPPARKQSFRFLHVSTDEVFGSLGEDAPAFSEATPYAPNSPYSASKAASDHFVRAYHHTYGLPTLTTNCSNNYGPYQFPEKLIPLILLNALQEKALPVYGDGLNIRDWLYVEDHCLAIRAVLERGKLGETYNIGGLNEVRNIDLVRILCASLDALAPRPGGARYSDLITFVPDRPGHDRRYAMDCTKITTHLSWRPLETFETGLRKTVEWYLRRARGEGLEARG